MSIFSKLFGGKKSKDKEGVMYSEHDLTEIQKAADKIARDIEHMTFDDLRKYAAYNRARMLASEQIIVSLYECIGVSYEYTLTAIDQINAVVQNYNERTGQNIP